MEVIVESTMETKRAQAVLPLQRWRGVTASGIPVTLWVHQCELEDESRRREFEMEINRVKSIEPDTGFGYGPIVPDPRCVSVPEQD